MDIHKWNDIHQLDYGYTKLIDGYRYSIMDIHNPIDEYP